MTIGTGEPRDAEAPADDELDRTIVRGRAATPGAPADSVIRRPPTQPSDDADAHDRLVSEIDAETGSTVVVRRESRRRAELAARDAGSDLDVTIVRAGIPPFPATVAGDVPARPGRGARSPSPAQRVYDVASPRSVVATRQPRPTYTPHAPVDTAGMDAAQRRRARRRAVFFVAGVSIVVVAAAILLVLLIVRG